MNTSSEHKKRGKMGIDMSLEAIDQRLRELGQLYELGREIQGARWLGTLEEFREAAEKDGPRRSPDR